MFAWSHEVVGTHIRCIACTRDEVCKYLNRLLVILLGFASISPRLRRQCGPLVRKPVRNFQDDTSVEFYTTLHTLHQTNFFIVVI